MVEVGGGIERMAAASFMEDDFEGGYLPVTPCLHILPLLRNETCTKVGEAFCLEIRRKDSRNEA